MEKKKDAENTNYLVERIVQNEKSQSIDINAWAFQNIKHSTDKLNILELCCGTGKQTEYLLGSFPHANVSVLDTSRESIELVKSQFSSEGYRMKFHLSDIDSFFENNSEKFDIIFCSYGLYYSKKIDWLLLQIYDRLNPKGRFVVMGPFGKNNKKLFDDLTSVGVSLAPLVVHSSCHFMYEDVLKFGVDKFRDMHIFTTKNIISWKTSESVLSYWESSTFYSQQCRTAFNNLVEAELKVKGEYRNEKNIMIIELVKHD
jgi:SAM-dependent methyltransferase